MKFTCIIPAYNEGPRIAKVLATVLSSEEIEEVIVVDDGSRDNTWEILSGLKNDRLVLIRSEKNFGKAHAVLTGIKFSKSDYIVMIDSDLLHLSHRHIELLIRPVVENEVDVTLSLRQNSLPIYKFLGTDFVSGERVIPKSVFDDEGYFLDGPGFGLEVKINQKIVENGFRIKNIPLSGLITPRKSLKYGWILGAFLDLKMVIAILSTFPFPVLLRQIWYFSRFSKKAESPGE